MPDQRVRLGPKRAEVLHHLRSAGTAVPVAEVASAVGLHANTTRFHLDALAASGLVIREPEQREHPGRPRVLYRAAHGHRRNHYQELAAAMVRHFAGALEDRVDRARAAGQAWGAELRAGLERTQPGTETLGRLVDCMAELGYQPRLETGPEPVVVLRPCPFLDLTGVEAALVCQLHLGLARGVLGPGQPWQATSVEPWVTPERCLLHLTRLEPDATTQDTGAGTAAHA